MKRLPLQTGELAMDLQAKGTGWLLLSSKQLNTREWTSRITEVQLSPQGISQTLLLSFQAPLPAWSLAGDQDQLFVGLGHPPFQSETSPGHCHSADRLSGNVLKFKHL